MSVIDVTPDVTIKIEIGGGIMQETDPTVPAWAKQPKKPTYTAEEVGAASKERVDKIAEDIENLKNSSSAGGLSVDAEGNATIGGSFTVDEEGNAMI